MHGVATVLRFESLGRVEMNEMLLFVITSLHLPIITCDSVWPELNDTGISGKLKTTSRGLAVFSNFRNLLPFHPISFAKCPATVFGIFRKIPPEIEGYFRGLTLKLRKP